jgi:hypothetical protein
MVTNTSFVIARSPDLLRGTKQSSNRLCNTRTGRALDCRGVILASLERLLAMTSSEDCRVAMRTAFTRLLEMTMPDSWKVTLRTRNPLSRHCKYAKFSKGHTFAKAGWRSTPSFEAK